MSETETEPQAPAVPEPVSDEPTVKELAGKVDRLIDLVSGGARATADSDGEPEPPSVKAEVQAELKRLKAAEQAKAERDAEKAELSELKDKVKKVTEKPPREYRKVTKFFGWAGDDE